LSLLALGVSALSSKEKTTPFFWFLWWIFGWIVTPIAQHTEPWLRYLGFGFNLHQIELHTFRVGEKIQNMTDSIPVLGGILHLRETTRTALETPHIAGTCAALLLMLGLAAWIVNQRVKPE